jgi:TatD DNase family protein
MLFDTHCHLDFPQLVDRIPEVIQEAEKMGVTRMLTIGCDLETSRKAAGISERFPRIVHAAVGIHPNEAVHARDTDLEEIRELAFSADARAIGEIGLDYYRDHTPRKTQLHWFHQQWVLAQELQLPVVLHCRDAMEDMLALLEEWTEEPGVKTRIQQKEIGIMHCFSGTVEQAARCLELGLMIGIGGPVTYPKSDALREVARTVPLSKLLVETDAPFLAPQERRGKTNQPAYTRYTAEFIAELKGIQLAELARETTENALRILSMPRTAQP